MKNRTKPVSTHADELRKLGFTSEFDQRQEDAGEKKEIDADFETRFGIAPIKMPKDRRSVRKMRAQGIIPMFCYFEGGTFALDEFAMHWNAFGILDLSSLGFKKVNAEAIIQLAKGPLH